MDKYIYVLTYNYNYCISQQSVLNLAIFSKMPAMRRTIFPHSKKICPIYGKNIFGKIVVWETEKLR